MKIHSEGHRINPGACLEYRLVVSEESLLDFEWQTEDDLEVKFSMTFMPEGGSKETVLIAPKNSKARKGTVEINDPGTCLLLWTNYYTLFQSPTLRYVASVRKRQDVLDEEARMEEENEKRQALDEELASKRQALDEKIASLHGEAAKMQHDAAAQQEICASREAEVAALRERLGEMEENLAAAVAHAQEMENSTNAKLQEISALEAERDQINEDGTQNHELLKQSTVEQTTVQSHDEPTTIEQSSTDEPTNIEQTSTDEPTTVEQTSTDEPVTVEQPSADEPTTVEQTNSGTVSSDML